MVLRVDVDAGARLEQDARGLGLAEERREVERREAVGREGRGPRRVLVQSLPQAVDVAERGRLEDVEVGVDREQRVGQSRANRYRDSISAETPASVARGDERRVLGEQRGDAAGIVGVDGGDEVFLAWPC